MKLPADLQPGEPTRICGAPEGFDARVLAALAEKARHTAGRAAGVLHVARDDRRLQTLAEALAFFAPDVEVVQVPAWDCLPYDRVSPSVEIVARRVEAFARLAEAPTAPGPRVVLTTVNAAVQRVPAPAVFAQARRYVATGIRLDRDDLQSFLVNQGYRRAQTVREPGEYAARGDILDVFPPSAEEPVRLDLFGDTVERLRSFDPISQLTTGKLESLTLRPMGEAFLDDASIQRFRRNYRALFGAVTDDDPLYAAISEGRPRNGMEHWLPLFHEAMATLFDYVPGGPVSLDGDALEGRDNRIAQVADFQAAREQVGQAGGQAYKPLPPAMLFLDAEEWDKRLAERPVFYLSPFGAPAASESEAVPAHILDAGGRPGVTFTESRLDPNQDLYAAFGRYVSQLRQDGKRLLLTGYTAGAVDRLKSLLAEHGIEGLTSAEDYAEARRQDPRAIGLIVLPLEHGFDSPDLAVVTEQDLLGERLARPARSRKRKADQFISEISALNPGDLVVHVEHGIGRFEGLETISVSGAPHDCLRLVYDGGNKLFLPVENLEMLSRYGSEEAGVQLDKLGGTAWQARRAKVKQRIKELADRLINIAAQRHLNRAATLTPPEGAFDEFCARFPYPETEDQLSAIAATLEDMASGKPMDRLVCGDVGFGKTEVALRAAFVAVMSGYQVGVVVPTTLLARQHFETFQQRFRDLPVRIGQLSRMVSQKEANRVKREMADGQLDIVVGTHAMLGKNVRFQRLGLLVVDEEQHFGVRQKEKLKELSTNVHVLTMTATPIPRTLQMALTGVREMSLITTPPVDRLAVRSFVLPFDPVVIREALMREHKRGGQSFYVCPRVRDIPDVAAQLAELVPELSVVQAHGQMGADALEKAMTAFYEGQYDILLCTNIIESGLDIPATNTLIVHNADLFGMAQLYQLRGRVGRSKVRAYAYLTTPARKRLSTSAEQRLRVLETLDTLGAGFTLASHDLDQRGAGNLLGDEQSGHVKEVGVELYQQMLEEAVAHARGGESGETAEEQDWTPQINIGMPVMIPEGYVADLNVRLSLYRRLADLKDRQEIDAFATEMIDRFGELPEAVENLLAVVHIKCLCREANIERVDAGPKGATVSFRDNSFAAPEKLVQFISQEPGTAKLRPDHKLVVKRDWAMAQNRLTGLRRLMEKLAQLARPEDAAQDSAKRGTDKASA